ncbi:hypothetical protein EP7_001197 [Isosphaeraceae bacterium EP7]
MNDRQWIQKPGSVTAIGLISLVWSLVSLVGFGALALAAIGLGTLSWLGGPVFGAVGLALGIVLIILAGLKSMLSLVLFFAAWRTLEGRPSGRSLHRVWAWTILVVDALDLIFTGGMDPTAWWGLGYAFTILFITDQPEARAFFDREQRAWSMPRKVRFDTDF